MRLMYDETIDRHETTLNEKWGCTSTSVTNWTSTKYFFVGTS